MPDDPARTPEPILMATANPHKVAELRPIFAALGIPVVGLAELAAPDGSPATFTEPTESGSTFEENAAIKAMSYAWQTGRMCVADDSGLEIDALGGRPGVISSHYSTGGRDTGLSRPDRDQANNALVLRELAGVPEDRRTARFVCVMALAAPGPRTADRPSESGGTGHKPEACATGPVVLAHARGVLEGRIGLPASELPESRRAGAVPRGSNGFGYDPIFLLAPRFDRTGAELAREAKNRVSHRAAAAAALARQIRQTCPPGGSGPRGSG